MHYLLAGGATHRLGHPGTHLGQARQHPDLLPEGAGQVLHVQQALDSGSYFIDVMNPQGQGHSFLASKSIDQHGVIRSPDSFKKQRRAALLADPVGDFGYFQDRIDRNPHPTQQPPAFQHFNELPEITVSH